MSKAKLFVTRIKEDKVFRDLVNECRVKAEELGLSIGECAQRLSEIANENDIEISRNEIVPLLVKGNPVSEEEIEALAAGAFRVVDIWCPDD